MTTRRDFGRGVLGALMGPAALAFGMFVLSGCQKVDENAIDEDRYRYRMTIEVETPEGPRSGYAVREVTFHDAGGAGIFSFGESRPRLKLQGEAIAVDLPDGKTLFGLLAGENGNGDYAKRIVDEALSNPATGEPWDRTPRIVELWPDIPDEKQRSRYVPMLVTFEDMSDPTSVQKVEADDLAATFGEGYGLRAITISITDDSITQSIKQKLHWVSDSKRKRFDPNAKPEGIPLGNYTGLFTTERFQK